MKRRICVFLLLLTCITTFNIFAQKQRSLKIDITKKYQVVNNFGASDCWTAQFFGLFPDAKKDQMADWLFSMDTDPDGKPKGIGLSLWRFNIGAGSAEQGKNSYIPNITRRSECFQLPDGSYDWNKQKGQRWFLQAARKRGVGQFLAFCLSAPPQMSMNGLANNRFRPDDGTFNIKPDKYPDYADFLATVIDEVQKKEGVRFQYLSPFNEPEWNWSGNTTQEGTPALMSEIAKTVRLLDEKLTEKSLDTKIIVTESGQIDYMFRPDDKMKGRSDQIETFFNPASENYIGNLKHVPSFMGGHSYWTTSSDILAEKRESLRKKLDQYNLGFWQTELCIMSNDKEIGGGGNKDLTMKTALYVARVIHHDLCVANASGWQWWLGMTNSDYKDGLVYVTPNESLTDGEISDSKLMWTFGNFSRFIRPGAVRVDVSLADGNTNDPDGLMVSAYYHPESKKISIVLINYSDQEERVKLNFNGLKTGELTPYVTSDLPGDNLMPKAKVKNSIQVPAKSVVTLTN